MPCAMAMQRPPKCLRQCADPSGPWIILQIQD